MIAHDGSELSPMGLVLHKGIDSMRGRYHLESVNPQGDFQHLLKHGIVLHAQEAEKGGVR